MWVRVKEMKTMPPLLIECFHEHVGAAHATHSCRQVKEWAGHHGYIAQSVRRSVIITKTDAIVEKTNDCRLDSVCSACIIEYVRGIRNREYSRPQDTAQKRAVHQVSVFG